MPYGRVRPTVEVARDLNRHRPRAPVEFGHVVGFPDPGDPHEPPHARTLPKASDVSGGGVTPRSATGSRVTRSVTTWGPRAPARRRGSGWVGVALRSVAFDPTGRTGRRG